MEHLFDVVVPRSYGGRGVVHCDAYDWPVRVKTCVNRSRIFAILFVEPLSLVKAFRMGGKLLLCGADHPKSRIEDRQTGAFLVDRVTLGDFSQQQSLMLVVVYLPRNTPVTPGVS